MAILAFASTEKATAGPQDGRVAPTVAEEGALAAPFVSMTAGEAAALVHGRFGITGNLVRFATEKDDTFRVDTSNQCSYVLKVSNPFEAESEIALQCALLQHVATANPRIPISRLLPDSDGKSLFAITDEAGQHRYVRLMTYMQGTPLDSTDSSAIEREQIGEVLGQLRLAMSDFAHSADSRVLAWDVQHLPGLRPLLDSVVDPKQRARLAEGLDRFVAFGSRIERLRRQVLHNDFNKSNIVVDHGYPGFVTGIIDFGDAVRTAVAIDVSTALLAHLSSDRSVNDIFREGRDVLRGYLRVADLNQEELELIPHLTIGRAIARALITLWRAQLHPNNSTYILRNTPHGWGPIEWYLDRSAAQVSQTLLSDICKP